MAILSNKKKGFIAAALIAGAGLAFLADTYPITRKLYTLPQLQGCPQPSAELSLYLSGKVHGEAFLDRDASVETRPFVIWDDGIFRTPQTQLWDPRSQQYREDVDDLTKEIVATADDLFKERLDAARARTQEAIGSGVDALKKEYETKGVLGMWRSREAYKEQAAKAKGNIEQHLVTALDSDALRCGQSIAGFAYVVARER